LSFDLVCSAVRIDLAVQAPVVALFTKLTKGKAVAPREAVVIAFSAKRE